MLTCLEGFVTETQTKLYKNYYESFTEKSIRDSVDTRDKISDMSKHLPLLSRILTSVCELCHNHPYLPH